MPDDAHAPPPARADRRAPADHPLLDAIAERWSPRAFDPDRPLAEADMLPLLEAARWAASSCQPATIPAGRMRISASSTTSPMAAPRRKR